MKKFYSLESKYKIVFLRHGETKFSKEKRLTGWYDEPLTENGCLEAQKAGKLLKENGYTFDMGYTSVLSRAIETYNIVAKTLGCLHIPVEHSWRLNERNYGSITGKSISEITKEFGEEQYKVFRWSFDVVSPEIDMDSLDFAGNNEKYQMIPRDVLPRSESMKTTIERVKPYWADTICPSLYYGRQVIVVAHTSTIRAMVYLLEKVSEKEIMELDTPTAIPLVYELDKHFGPVTKYYLGSS